MNNPFRNFRKKFPQVVFMDENEESYLDSASSSLKIDAGLEAMKRFYETSAANVHRGEHHLSLKATEKYERAREKTAQFLGAHSNEIVFTRGATESLNLLSESLSGFLEPEDEILTTQMEHHSNFVPWQRLAQKKSLKFNVSPVTSEGALNLKSFERLLGPKTKIIALTHISNVTGVLNPLDQLIPLIRKKTKAFIVVDAAQSASCQKIDVKKMDCDFLVFSGHKVFAPSGIGVLFGKKALLESLPPYQTGGGMILDVNESSSQWTDSPHKFEAGTPFIEGAIALGEVLSFLQKELDFEELLKWEKTLVSQAEEFLSQIPNLRFIGPADNRTNILSFIIEGMHSSDLAFILTKQKTALRSGHHCCMPLIKALNLKSGAVRASFSVYNTKEDVYRLKKAVDTAVSLLSS